MIAGRVYLGVLARELAAAAASTERIAARVQRAIELYPDPALVGRVLNGALSRGNADPAVVRAAAARAFAQHVPAPADLDAALTALYADPRTPAQPRRQQATTLQPFREQAMSGKIVDPADYRGKVVLVDFWATWCGPCLRGMPALVDAYREYHERGLDIIGVSLDKPNAQAQIRATEQRLGMTWEQIYDGGNAKLAKANGIRSIPATFLLDRKGELRHVGLHGEDLRRAIAALIDE
jgi:thiol-disulfide isomerase/thioredoxin